MANFEFNLFDELENSDPRVEHYLQSRLDARHSNNNGNSSNSNSSLYGNPSTRIHVSRIPASVQDSSLKDVLIQHGNFTDYHRQRDLRAGVAIERA